MGAPMVPRPMKAMRATCPPRSDIAGCRLAAEAIAPSPREPRSWAQTRGAASGPVPAPEVPRAPRLRLLGARDRAAASLTTGRRLPPHSHRRRAGDAFPGLRPPTFSAGTTGPPRRARRRRGSLTGDPAAGRPGRPIARPSNRTPWPKRHGPGPPGRPADRSGAPWPHRSEGAPSRTRPRGRSRAARVAPATVPGSTGSRRSGEDRPTPPPPRAAIGRVRAPRWRHGWMAPRDGASRLSWRGTEGQPGGEWIGRARRFVPPPIEGPRGPERWVAGKPVRAPIGRSPGPPKTVAGPDRARVVAAVRPQPPDLAQRDAGRDAPSGRRACTRRPVASRASPSLGPHHPIILLSLRSPSLRAGRSRPTGSHPDPRWSDRRPVASRPRSGSKA